MTYYDRLNEFFRANAHDAIPATAQLLYLHLLHINNSLGNVGEFRCTDSYLKTVTNLSKDGVTAAKRYLKNKGYIDFKSSKTQGTIYFLKQGTKQGNLQGTEQGTKQGNLQGRILRKEEEEEKIIPNNTEARVRENYSVNSVEVTETWFKCEGEHLTGGNALGLIELENLYGTAKVVQAIIAASQANTQPRLSFNFVKAVLLRILKGGEKNGRNESVGRVDECFNRYAEYAGDDVYPG